MASAARIGLVALAVLVLAGSVGAGALRAASANDPAGVPFVTFAHAMARGDYALACAQLSDRFLLDVAQGFPAAEPIRRRCPAILEKDVESFDRARLASTRVIAVHVKPGRARVTVRTTFHDLEPTETGTAIVENGSWKISELTAGAHVGTNYLYRVPSWGMAPALPIGSTILADHAAYRNAKPVIGDIVLFHPPAGAEHMNACGKRPPKGQACAVAIPRTADVNFVKRIVGKPGDRLSIRKGRVFRNGKRAAEPFIRSCRSPDASCDFPRTFTVAKGHYYVLGDNRGESDDSRFWGPVPAKAIVGRVGRVIPAATR